MAARRVLSAFEALPFKGARAQRFVYLRIGTYAGQTGTDVARRAKIGLEGITLTLLETG